MRHFRNALWLLAVTSVVLSLWFWRSDIWHGVALLVLAISLLITAMIRSTDNAQLLMTPVRIASAFAGAQSLIAGSCFLFGQFYSPTFRHLCFWALDRLVEHQSSLLSLLGYNVSFYSAHVRGGTLTADWLLVLLVTWVVVGAICASAYGIINYMIRRSG